MEKDPQKFQNVESVLPSPTSFSPTPLIDNVHSESEKNLNINRIESGKSLDQFSYKWKFSEEMHSYAREYIRNADQKAAFFFAAATGLIAFIYKGGLIYHWLKSPTQWNILDLLSFLATIALSGCAIFCVGTVMPRLRGSKRGIIYFNAVSEYESSKDYANDVLQRNCNDLVFEKLTHYFTLAKICKRKFLTINIALYSGAIGIISTILLLIITQS